MNNTTKRTELPITVLTDYEYRQDDLLESVRQQIEQSGFHLQTLFNNLKRSALFMETYFTDDAPDTVRGFCNDLMNTSDIGNGLCLNVWRAVSELTEIQMKDGEEETVISTASPLAEMLSFILTAKEVPIEITEAISDALVEMANSSKQREVLGYEKTAEHIGRVLRDYWQMEDGDENL